MATAFALRGLLFFTDIKLSFTKQTLHSAADKKQYIVLDNKYTGIVGFEQSFIL
jgi:hypothetical protein